jgi:copper chaperone NosL
MLVLAAAPTGCSKHETESTSSTATTAEAIGTAECGACGMVVREQPAPRAQVVYAEGKRVFFCSIGDLAHYLATPSPDGAPSQVYVEVLAPNEDPKQKNTSEHRWIPATDAHYVLGVERQGVMGKPALVYVSRQEASAAAARHGGKTLDYSALRRELIKGEVAHQH